jgi:hypothetical protein
MSDQISLPNLQAADELLSKLSSEVQKWEGTLSGGTKLGIGATAVESLFQTKVSFGNPRDQLIQLTETTFQESGTELTDIYRQQMQSQYDFYYLTLTISLIPKPGVRFRRLTCQLDFSADNGNTIPIVQTLFPDQKWREVFNFGVGMDVGLDGNLDWSVGVDESLLDKVRDLLPAELKAKAATKNNFKAFMAVPSYKYELGYSEITASGEGDSMCYWRIQDQELQKLGTARFAIVFKVPKGTEMVNLEGVVWAEPDMNWLTSDIRDVFSDLSNRIKSLLKSKDDAAIHFARGDAEEWVLTLPKVRAFP